jgi:hypothetical protein
MGTVLATDEELIEKKRRQQRLRRQRDKERELLGKPKRGLVPKEAVSSFYAAKAIVESAEDVITTGTDLSRERNKDVPYVVGHSGVGRPPKDVSIKRRLKEVLAAQAQHVEESRVYCEMSGIDPKDASVMDCVIHNWIYWSLKGSAPHLKELVERVDGKVIPRHDLGAGGKMSITDAVNMIEMGPRSDDDD